MFLWVHTKFLVFLVFTFSHIFYQILKRNALFSQPQKNQYAKWKYICIEHIKAIGYTNPKGMKSTSTFCISTSRGEDIFQMMCFLVSCKTSRPKSTTLVISTLCACIWCTPKRRIKNLISNWPTGLDTGPKKRWSKQTWEMQTLCLHSMYCEIFKLLGVLDLFFA